jgi:glyoxylate/hydroxypyruvate reductase A
LAVLLVSDYGANIEKWRRALAAVASGPRVRTWEDAGDSAEIDIIITDACFGPARSYRRFPNLRWVHFLGHGASDVLMDPTLPPDVIVTRLVDPAIISGLTEYVVQAVTTIHLRVAEFAELQRKALWNRLTVAPACERQVAVLGLGAIGARIASILRDLGFQVSGWSQGPKQVAGIRCVSGREALGPLLEMSDFVVCVLPETEKTRGLFDETRFSQMKDGAYFINVGRGSLVVQDALLAALNRRKLSGACLDVFPEEPLPAESPIWSHPLIRATPHTGGAGGDGDQFSAVVENYRRFLAGRELVNVVDRTKGY